MNYTKMIKQIQSEEEAQQEKDLNALYYDEMQQIGIGVLR